MAHIERSMAALLASGGALASAAILHDESVNGDLSGDRFNPTGYVLGDGVNSVLATSVSGDREYLRLTVPAGRQLSQVNLVSYAGLDGTAFIGVQAGTTFTEPPTGTNVAKLLGWTHFGPNLGNVGTDVLDDMGLGAGAIGFTPPLPAGDYAFWMQQTGVNASSYRFDFVSVPEPASLLAMALLTPLLRRR